MAFDESVLREIRDGMFARRAGRMNATTLTDDEFKPKKQLLGNYIRDLAEAEKRKILDYVFGTIPEAEYEGAVECLKRTVSPKSLRELVGILERDQRNGKKTEIEMPGLMQIRGLLRRGGFDWRGTYLDKFGQELMIEAAKRYAKENALSGNP